MIRFRSALTLLAAATLTACSGSDGKDGENGITGPQGPAGNANVEIFDFGPRTFTGTQNLTLAVSRAKVDSSAVFVYYNPEAEAETSWYSVPGLGSGGFYDTRFFLTQSGNGYMLSLRTMMPNGSGAYNQQVTFRKIRVVLLKASSITATATLQRFNLQDYEIAKQALNLPN